MSIHFKSFVRIRFRFLVLIMAFVSPLFLSLLLSLFWKKMGILCTVYFRLIIILKNWIVESEGTIVIYKLKEKPESCIDTNTHIPISNMLLGIPQQCMLPIPFPPLILSRYPVISEKVCTRKEEFTKLLMEVTKFKDPFTQFRWVSIVKDYKSSFFFFFKNQNFKILKIYGNYPFYNK